MHEITDQRPSTVKIPGGGKLYGEGVIRYEARITEAEAAMGLRLLCVYYGSNHKPGTEGCRRVASVMAGIEHVEPSWIEK